MGLATEIANAAPGIRRREHRERIGIAEVLTLEKDVRGAIATALTRFAGIDRASSTSAALAWARARE